MADGLWSAPPNSVARRTYRSHSAVATSTVAPCALHHDTISKGVGDIIVTPALTACDVTAANLRRVEVQLPGNLRREKITDLSSPASEFVAADGSASTIFVVLGRRDEDFDPSVKALRDEHIRQRKKRAVLLCTLGCLLSLLLLALLVGATLLIVYLTTTRSPASLLAQARRTLPEAFGSLVQSAPPRHVVQEPWSPRGRASSLGPPWSVARPWLQEIVG